MKKLYWRLFFVDLIFIICWLYIFKSVEMFDASLFEFSSYTRWYSTSFFNGLLGVLGIEFLIVLGILGYKKNLVIFRRLNFGIISACLSFVLFFLFHMQKYLSSFSKNVGSIFCVDAVIITGIIALFRKEIWWSRMLAILSILFGIFWLFYGLILRPL